MLSVRLSRRADGAVVLRCRRADGTETWQRQDARHADFFAFHDLRHLAVETVLGFRRGFYGLIAEGWAIEETTGKGARGPLPEEARLAEHVVGLLDRERVGGAPPLSAEAFNAELDALARQGRIGEARHVTAEELDRVRARAQELHEAWARVGAGGELELSFRT